MCETKPRKTSQKISKLLVGPEQVTMPKTLEAIVMMTVLETLELES